MMPKWETVAIVGVGLIGGSIGLALRERRLADVIVGIGRTPGKLARAKRLGAITSSSTHLARGVRDAELVIVCTPVEQVPEFVAEAVAAAPSHCLFTDVGSTKSVLVGEVERRWPAERTLTFVGSHPMAGSDRTGVEHARAHLLEKRAVILTPTRRNSGDPLQAIDGFWKSLGAHVTSMKPDEHDRLVAGVSHLPHLVAAALAGSTADADLPFAASGWSDTTRIAAGDVEMWRQILQSNRTQVLRSLQRFEQLLDKFHRALELDQGRELAKLLALGKDRKDRRDALGS